MSSQGCERRTNPHQETDHTVWIHSVQFTVCWSNTNKVFYTWKLSHKSCNFQNFRLPWMHHQCAGCRSTHILIHINLSGSSSLPLNNNNTDYYWGLICCRGNICQLCGGWEKKGGERLFFRPIEDLKSPGQWLHWPMCVYIRVLV